jgi:hypothetical protein
VGLGVPAVCRVLRVFSFVFCLLVFGFLCILHVCVEAPYVLFIYLFYIYFFDYLSKKKKKSRKM